MAHTPNWLFLMKSHWKICIQWKRNYKKITILNSKIRESGKFQKDSQYIIDFNYENGDYQRIEITGNNTIIFNYCSANEFPKFFLDNKSSSYDTVSLERDNITHELFFYDPQSGNIIKGKQLVNYINRHVAFESSFIQNVIYTNPQILRVDNMDFNITAVNHVMRSKENA